MKSLGLEVLAAVCERLAKNYRHTRSGFPDLIVWNPNNKVGHVFCTPVKQFSLDIQFFFNVKTATAHKLH